MYTEDRVAQHPRAAISLDDLDKDKLYRKNYTTEMHALISNQRIQGSIDAHGEGNSGRL